MIKQINKGAHTSEKKENLLRGIVRLIQNEEHEEQTETVKPKGTFVGVPQPPEHNQ